MSKEADDLPSEVYMRVTFAPDRAPNYIRLRRFLKIVGRWWNLRCQAFVEPEQLPKGMVEIEPDK